MSLLHTSIIAIFSAKINFMKKVSLTIITLLLCFLTIQAQQTNDMDKPTFNYAQHWAQIDSLIKNARLRDALAKVEEVLTAARQEDNGVQLYKGLTHKVNMIEPIEEKSDSMKQAILLAELEGKVTPTLNLLHALVGNFYHNYYQQNRWRINERTALEVKADDFQTWDVKTLMEAAAEHFVKALDNAEQLQQIPVEQVNELLDKGKDSEKYRPTLYDILAHKTIDFFQNNETGLARPANEFELQARQAFLPAGEYVKQSFTSDYQWSRDRQAAEIFQQVLAFHLKSGNTYALVDADFKRLQFAKSHAIGEDADTLYLRALEHLEQKHEAHPISATASYKIAQLYRDRAGKYNPLNEEDEFKWDNRKALNLCEKAVEAFPESEGAGLCKNLILQIKQKELEVQTTIAQLPNEDFLLYCRYRNVGKVYVRLAKITDEQIKTLQAFQYNEQEQRMKFLRDLPVIVKDDCSMPEDPDYNSHSVELPVSGVPIGKYIVMVSDHPAFKSFQHAVGYTLCYVTELSMVYEQQDNNMHIMALDRQSGKPLKKVNVELLVYDRELRGYRSSGKSQYTGKSGEVRFPFPYENYNTAIKLTKGDDHFETRSELYGYRENPPFAQPQTYFFLDRNLYRPGQTIYFKALCLRKDGKQSRLAPGQDVTITFRDANNQEKYKVDFKTNEFGTFHGSFIAPSSGLMGRMYLRSNFGNGVAEFRVEEYKRPTFEVNFEPLSGSYRLGEEVKAIGQAKAYAGSSLGDVEVKYRVVRQARFPYWGWRWWLPQPSSPQREIISGSVRTDVDGKFEIPFDLIPDATVKKNTQPIFSYTVYADVVDITGETRSSQTEIRAGYVSMDVSFQLADKLNLDKAGKAKVIAKNLSGEKEKAVGTVTVYRMQDPGRLLRERRWPQPDKYLMSQAEFAKRFPHDAYGTEHNPRSWKRGEQVAIFNFDTEKSEEIDLAKLSNVEPGYYSFELKTKDTYGADIQLQDYARLEESEAAKPAIPTVLAYDLNQNSFQPGEIAKIRITTSAKKIYVLQQQAKGKTILKESTLKVKGGKEVWIEIPIREKDRGGLSLSLTAVHENRLHNYHVPISVPWSNKQLTLEWETFRSKLKPGQEEEWSLTIKGPQGEAVAAEMVAAMYDASLDALYRPHNFPSLSLFPNYWRETYWQGNNAFSTARMPMMADGWNKRPQGVSIHGYDQLQGMTGGNIFFAGGPRYMRNIELSESMNATFMMDGDADAAVAGAPEPKMAKMPARSAGVVGGAGESMPADEIVEKESDGSATSESLSDLPVRSNLNETAFFLPQVRTDEEGNTVLKFTMPEALTRWKFQAFAHTDELQSGALQDEVITQKELMVTPNVPRFMRQGDAFTLTAKVANLSESDLDGSAQLFLLDAGTMEDVGAQFGYNQVSTPFKVEAGRSEALKWELKVPFNVPVVIVRVIAKAGEFSDGEEHILPILSNRMLVTESMPLPVRGGEERTFRFKKLMENNSPSLVHQRLTLEFTSNPAWYAVQSLPYLMEYPHECAEQIFSRFYANALASHIATSTPRIKQVFDQWRSQAESDAEARSALASALETNQELKNVLLEETPWLLNANNEAERKQRIALLFDLNRMADELGRAKDKLTQMQNPDGGFGWFPGMRSNAYITNIIVTGFGHLNKLGVGTATADPEVATMINKALPFLDKEMKKSYDYLMRYTAKDDLKKNHLSHAAINYLYMRTFYSDVPLAGGTEEAYSYYWEQALTYWNEQNNYAKGMLAITFHRKDNPMLSEKVLEGLRQQAVMNPELGMYWKQPGGYYWYQAPIEQQAMLIEAFHEAGRDMKSVEEMKIWLLKNKQTNDWKTTRATVAACNALLMVGTDLLNANHQVDIQIAGKTIDPYQRPDAKVEAGTGYFKTAWLRQEVKPEMGEVVVKKQGPGVAWGAMYWQYFEDLDKITYAETPLSIQKALFVEENTAEGPKLIPVADRKLKPGDKIIVRIELRVDRDMEYVHMKDQRAAGFEPINVISQYKYRDGLGYYESTRDASTHFFFSHLRGNQTYVFEYPLRVNHAGDFSNGITTAQCMYAPEYTSHSEGSRIEVK
jgi:uncharacterized protein YfaS (alpha-2-macroglobulin family)